MYKYLQKIHTGPQGGVCHQFEESHAYIETEISFEGNILFGMRLRGMI